MSQRNYYVPESGKKRRKRRKKKNNSIMLIMCGIIVVLLILIALLLFSIIGDSNTQNTPEPTVAPTQYIEPTIAPTSTPEPINRADVFLNEIKSKLDGQIANEDESYTNIALNGKNVYIGVDISKVDTGLLTRALLAESRTGSITDAFLNITEYDDLWDSVTVDFGNTGVVTLYKTDIEVNEYNMRYFNSLKYIDKFK